MVAVFNQQKTPLFITILGRLNIRSNIRVNIRSVHELEVGRRWVGSKLVALNLWWSQTFNNNTFKIVHAVSMTTAGTSLKTPSYQHKLQVGLINIINYA